MDAQKVIERAFYGSLTVIACWIASEISDISKNMVELNTKVAVLIERGNNFERRVEVLEEQMRNLKAGSHQH